jgi:hypothetical protein
MEKMSVSSGTLIFSKSQQPVFEKRLKPRLDGCEHYLSKKCWPVKIDFVPQARTFSSQKGGDSFSRRLLPQLESTRAVLFSIALCLTFGLPSLAQGEQSLSSHLLLTATQELPLDPLTPEEIELAAQIASADPHVQKELGPGRRQLIRVQFLALKAGIDLKTGQEQKLLKVGRSAAVLFYRYDTDQGIHVVVDLRQRAVGSISRLEGRAVPLALEEVTQAFALALLDRRVRNLLGSKADDFRVAPPTSDRKPANSVEGLRVVATAPGDPCYKHRCIELHFRKRESYVAGTSVTVDLSARRVRTKSTVR